MNKYHNIKKIILFCIFFSLSCYKTLAALSKEKNIYEVLGIEKNANIHDIKRAYRDQALKWHPDKNPDDQDYAEMRFEKVSAAYEIIINPETRKEYDGYLK